MKRSIGLWALCVIGCGAPQASDSRASAYTADDYYAWEKLVYGDYRDDVAGYWSQYGLPVLARLADLDATLESASATEVFSGLAGAFDENAFAKYYEAAAFPERFQKYLSAAIEGGLPPWDAYVSAVRATTQELDLDRLDTGEGSKETLGVIAELRDAFTAVFVADQIAVAPIIDEKTYEVDEKAPEDECAPVAAAPPPAPVASIDWGRITGSELWPSGKGDCRSAAAGACAAKLGLAGYNRQATCADWDRTADEIGAGTIDDFLENQGVHCQHVRACSVAAAGLQRGCDVFMRYRSAGGAHVEMVNWISPTSWNSCRAHTLSWGQDASVDFTDGQTTTGGKFTGKSDAASYDPPLDSGTGWFTVCCR